MRRCNGDIACKAARAAGATLPIIAMSANASASDRAHYAACGLHPTSMLAKPFTAAEMRAVLGEACGLTH